MPVIFVEFGAAAKESRDTDLLKRVLACSPALNDVPRFPLVGASCFIDAAHWVCRSHGFRLGLLPRLNISNRQTPQDSTHHDKRNFGLDQL
jgi:hypothetical protein